MSRVTINPRNVFNPQRRGRHNDPQGVPWSHAVKATGTFLYVSGQTAADLKGSILSPGDIFKQTEIALENLRKVVEAGGFEMRNIVQMMWFVTDAKRFYSTGASALRRKYFERGSYPASTLVEIRRLADPEAMVEVQAVAVSNNK